MKEIGIQVIMLDEDTECFAIIDQELVWHGGMNLLVKVDAWDNLIRIKSESVAEWINKTNAIGLYVKRGK